MKAFFHTNMPPLKVPDDRLFVLGDTWWRSIDSQIFGLLPERGVAGKVLGYEPK